MGLANYFRWAEVKERKDIYTWRGTTEWGNHDLYPTSEKDRTYGYWAYMSFWSQSGFSITTYTIGSGYIAVGLSQAETIAAIFVGSLISACVGIFGARPGMDYGIGYVSISILTRIAKVDELTWRKQTVGNRTVFGLRGTYLAIFIIFITGIIFVSRP